MDDNPLTITSEQNRLHFLLEFTRPEDAPQDIFRIQTRVEDFLASGGAGARETYALTLAVEELVLNVANYGAEPDGKNLPLRCDGEIVLRDGSAVFSLKDNGGAFDPNDSPRPPLDAPPEERPIGGLGLHMLKQYFSGLEYKRENGWNHSVWTIYAEAVS